jgi:hypothetical protein
MMPPAYIWPEETRALTSPVIRDVLPSAQREYSCCAAAGAFQSLLDRFGAAGAAGLKSQARLRSCASCPASIFLDVPSSTSQAITLSGRGHCCRQHGTKVPVATGGATDIGHVCWAALRVRDHPRRAQEQVDRKLYINRLYMGLEHYQHWFFGIWQLHHMPVQFAWRSSRSIMNPIHLSLHERGTRNYPFYVTCIGIKGISSIWQPSCSLLQLLEVSAVLDSTPSYLDTPRPPSHCRLLLNPNRI